MLHQLLNRVPAALIDRLMSPRGWAGLRQLATGLPPLSGAILEYHFGSRPRRLDLSLRTTRYDGGRATLAGQHGDWDFDRGRTTGPAWDTVFRFGDRWAAGNPIGFSTIEHVWLEFDLPPDQSVASPPCLFYDMDRDGRLSPKEQVRHIQSIDRSLRSTAGAAAYAHMRRLLRAAPPGVRLHYVGLLLGRPDAARRICLQGLAPAQVLPYLAAIGWTGASDVVTRILENVIGTDGPVVLNLDVGEQIGARIGIEVSYDSPADWPGFFDRATAVGYATPDEVAAVLAWPGDLPFGEDAFQRELSRAAGKPVTRLIKRLNHVKLVVGPEGEVRGKTYLYLAYF